MPENVRAMRPPPAARRVGFLAGARLVDLFLVRPVDPDRGRPDALEPERAGRADERLDREPLAERARDVRGEADVRDAMRGGYRANHSKHSSHTRNTPTPFRRRLWRRFVGKCGHA